MKRIPLERILAAIFLCSASSIYYGKAQAAKLLRTWDHVASSVCLSRDGKTMMTVGENVILVWNVQDGRVQQAISRPKLGFDSAALSPNGMIVVSCGSIYLDAKRKTSRLSGVIQFWDAKSGTLVKTLREQFKSGFGVCFSSTGDLIAAGTDKGELKLLSVRSGKVLRVFKGRSSIGHAAFSPDGKLVTATTSDEAEDDAGIYNINNQVRVWNISSGKKVRTFSILKDESLRLWSDDKYAKLSLVTEGRPVECAPILLQTVKIGFSRSLHLGLAADRGLGLSL